MEVMNGNRFVEVDGLVNNESRLYEVGMSPLFEIQRVQVLKVLLHFLPTAGLPMQQRLGKPLPKILF